jgi:hypothetical protein
MECDGCRQPIVDGQHYMKVTVELVTKMPDDWQPAVEVSTTYFALALHNPRCFETWVLGSAVMIDVFAR